VAVVVAQNRPAASVMAVPHGPANVGGARRRLRRELASQELPDAVIDDAVLILSELLSNSCRHARPLPAEGPEGPEGPEDAGSPQGAGGEVRVGWELDAERVLTLRVTDGGGPTRPRCARPSLTARGGRGLGIVGRIASRWGVDDQEPGEVTVWAALPTRASAPAHAPASAAAPAGGRAGVPHAAQGRRALR